MPSQDFTAALILSTSHAVHTAHAPRSRGANERESGIQKYSDSIAENKNVYYFLTVIPQQVIDQNTFGLHCAKILDFDKLL